MQHQPTYRQVKRRSLMPHRFPRLGSPTKPVPRRCCARDEGAARDGTRGRPPQAPDTIPGPRSFAEVQSATTNLNLGGPGMPGSCDPGRRRLSREVHPTRASDARLYTLRLAGFNEAFRLSQHSSARTSACMVRYRWRGYGSEPGHCMRGRFPSFFPFSTHTRTVPRPGAPCVNTYGYTWCS